MRSAQRDATVLILGVPRHAGLSAGQAWLKSAAAGGGAKSLPVFLAAARCATARLIYCAQLSA